MKTKKIAIFVLLLVGAIAASAQTGPIQNYCVQGATKSVTSGSQSSNYLQGVIPYCTVEVYLSGVTPQTLATIYSDGSSTPLTNPFTALANGQWTFYAAIGQGYDVVLSGGYPQNTYQTPITLIDLFPGNGPGWFTACSILTNPNGISCQQIDGYLNSNTPQLAGDPCQQASAQFGQFTTHANQLDSQYLNLPNVPTTPNCSVDPFLGLPWTGVLPGSPTGGVYNQGGVLYTAPGVNFEVPNNWEWRGRGDSNTIYFNAATVLGPHTGAIELGNPGFADGTSSNTFDSRVEGINLNGDIDGLSTSQAQVGIYSRGIQEHSGVFNSHVSGFPNGVRIEVFTNFCAISSDAYDGTTYSAVLQGCSQFALPVGQNTHWLGLTTNSALNSSLCVLTVATSSTSALTGTISGCSPSTWTSTSEIGAIGYKSDPQNFSLNDNEAWLDANSATSASIDYDINCGSSAMHGMSNSTGLGAAVQNNPGEIGYRINGCNGGLYSGDHAEGVTDVFNVGAVGGVGGGVIAGASGSSFNTGAVVHVAQQTTNTCTFTSFSLAAKVLSAVGSCSGGNPVIGTSIALSDSGPNAANLNGLSAMFAYASSGTLYFSVANTSTIGTTSESFNGSVSTGATSGLAALGIAKLGAPICVQDDQLGVSIISSTCNYFASAPGDTYSDLYFSQGFNSFNDTLLLPAPRQLNLSSPHTRWRSTYQIAAPTTGAGMQCAYGPTGYSTYAIITLPVTLASLGWVANTPITIQGSVQCPFLNYALGLLVRLPTPTIGSGGSALTAYQFGISIGYRTAFASTADPTMSIARLGIDEYAASNQVGSGTYPTSSSLAWKHTGTATGLYLFDSMVESPSFAPSLLYSVAGTPLPSCGSNDPGAQYTVSDATSIPVGNIYVGSGTTTAQVICSFNGSSYNWIQGEGSKASTSTLYQLRATSGATLAASTTYYAGSGVTGMGDLSYGAVKVYVEQACTVTAVTYYELATSNPTSGSTPTIDIWQNAATSIGSITPSWTAVSGGIINHVSGLSAPLAAGDYIAVRVQAPAWGTAPGGAVVTANVLCQ